MPGWWSWRTACTNYQLHHQAMVRRYAHVTARLRRDIADRLSTFLLTPSWRGSCGRYAPPTVPPVVDCRCCCCHRCCHPRWVSVPGGVAALLLARHGHRARVTIPGYGVYLSSTRLTLLAESLTACTIRLAGKLSRCLAITGPHITSPSGRIRMRLRTAR
jgi:hypothetical protein